MKRKAKSKKQTRHKRPMKQRGLRPREIYSALRRLLDTAQHVQARAAELENAIHLLREKEQTEAIRRILQALARSSAGDLTSAAPDASGNDPKEDFAKAVMESLIEAFQIQPIRKIGDIVSGSEGEPPSNVEPDRPLDGISCSAFEVVSVGWSRNGKILLKPRVRPLARQI